MRTIYKYDAEDQKLIHEFANFIAKLVATGGKVVSIHTSKDVTEEEWENADWTLSCELKFVQGTFSLEFSVEFWYDRLDNEYFYHGDITLIEDGVKVEIHGAFLTLRELIDKLTQRLREASASYQEKAATEITEKLIEAMQ